MYEKLTRNTTITKTKNQKLIDRRGEKGEMEGGEGKKKMVEEKLTVDHTLPTQNNGKNGGNNKILNDLNFRMGDSAKQCWIYLKGNKGKASEVWRGTPPPSTRSWRNYGTSGGDQLEERRAKPNRVGEIS